VRNVQALSLKGCNEGCNGDMPIGRPPKTNRSAFGARVHTLREQASLSQGEVAGKLGISQQSYAKWERRDVALSVAQLERLATILRVPVTAFFAAELTEADKPRGPVGRARKAFEAVSLLPRNQQTTILSMVESVVNARHREQAKKQPARVSAAG